VGRVGVIVKEDTHEMHHSLGGALGSILLLLIAGSIGEFTGRGFWSMAVGCMLWTVGRECGKGLDWRRTFVGKS
jgi:hypothetical protein